MYSSFGGGCGGSSRLEKRGSGGMWLWSPLHVGSSMVLTVLSVQEIAGLLHVAVYD